MSWLVGRTGLGIALVSLSWLAPFVVGAVIWAPLVLHYHVPTPKIGDAEIEALRRLPSDAVLSEISESGLIVAAGAGPAEKIGLARKAMSGELDLPGFRAIDIRLPFEAADLEKGPPTLQLHIAALVVPELLLEAYLETKEEEFFLAARDAIFAWAAYERRAWMPRGYLWNDHAVAARIPVLAKFWRIYRRHPAFTIEGARQVLQAVARSGMLLAKPGHFTFGTNHGVMQNIGLWQTCIAFPRLPGVERFQRVALNRLTQQLAFYVNDEGAVLEHSAGYQELGVSLLGLSVRYASILGIESPRGWQERYERSKRVYAQLRRPDGTLPMYGDTLNRADANLRTTVAAAGGLAKPLEIPEEWGSPAREFLAPAAGYAVWWDGIDRWPESRGLRQTVIVWGDHPGRAHKHADELSVLLWARGQTWWSNIGYWPYGEGNRRLAVSWEGSNAPHFVGETWESPRRTRMLYQATSDRLRFLDLLRTSEDGYAARRQVAHIGADVWLIIDEVRDRQGRKSRTTWTTFPSIVVTAGPSAGGYILRRQGDGPALSVSYLGSEEVTVRPFEGSMQPFAGWIVGDDGIAKTTALVVDMPSSSYAIGLWRLFAEGSPEMNTAPPELRAWEGPEAWKLMIPVGPDAIRVSRDGSVLLVEDPSGSQQLAKIDLSGPLPTGSETERTQRAYELLASEFRTMRELHTYRRKATILLLVLFLAQELLALAYRRVTRRPALALRIAAVTCWTLLGFWLHFVYFGA